MPMYLCIRRVDKSYEKYEFAGRVCEAQRQAGYESVPGGLFDSQIYKVRMRMSIEPFLINANVRDGRRRGLGGVRAWLGQRRDRGVRLRLVHHARRRRSGV